MQLANHDVVNAGGVSLLCSRGTQALMNVAELAYYVRIVIL